jgi:DNA-binding transcriptional ArsR family regulator
MATFDASQPLQLYRLPARDRTEKAGHRDSCVVALKALGEETRVRIIGLLIDKPLDVGEISERVGVSQYNVSKHLRILREAGLLEVEKSGRRRLYALPDAVRVRAAEQGILDLGCCSFTFDKTESKPRPGRTPRMPRR